jgi:hypothetical protein
MKVGTKFKIGYRAKKYNNEFIWREGIWTEECQESGQINLVKRYSLTMMLKERVIVAPLDDWVFTSSTVEQGVN